MLKTSAVMAMLLVGFSAQAQNADNGKTVFGQACASCHSLTSQKGPGHTGPALLGVTKRPGRSSQWLIDWISDPETVVKTDKLAQQLLKENNNVPMPAMLKALNGGDLAKAKKAAADVVEFLKQNDAKGDAGGDKPKKKG